MGEIIFEMPLTFPEDDFRKEYYGSVKNGCVLHGEGTLYLKNGRTFFGEWVNGGLSGRSRELQREERQWLKEN